ncbi:hypothetical protein Tco_0490066 [Tanacetum coccineum]
MTTLAEHMIVAGADNRPPMLEKTMYNSLQNHMLLYIKGKEHGRMMLNSILHGPLVYGTIELDDVTRTNTYEEPIDAEKFQDNCDVRATNIILQVLPPEVYSLVNHHAIAKQIWDQVKLLMQATELSRKEGECKLYNEFDRNDNAVARNMHTTNYDQLYAYLSQHEAHATEVRLMRERLHSALFSNSDALVLRDLDYQKSRRESISTGAMDTLVVLLGIVESKILNEFLRLLGAFVTNLTTGRMIDGVPCGGIDMVIKHLDLEPKIDAMMRDFLKSFDYGVVGSFDVDTIIGASSSTMIIVANEEAMRLSAGPKLYYLDAITGSLNGINDDAITTLLKKLWTLDKMDKKPPYKK